MSDREENRQREVDELVEKLMEATFLAARERAMYERGRRLYSKNLWFLIVAGVLNIACAIWNSVSAVT